MNNMKLKCFTAVTLIIMLAFSSIFFLSGCSSKKDADTTAPTTTEAQSEKSITLTIGRNAFSDDFDEAAFYAGLDDIGGVSYSKDESTSVYILIMSETSYNYLRKVKSREVTDAFEKVIADTTNYVENIKYNDDFREITIYADRDKFPAKSVNTLEITAVTVAASAMAYQIYTIDGQNTNVKVLYSDTSEVATQFMLPMSL